MSTEHIDIDPAKYFQLAAETEAQWPAMWALLNSITPGGWHIPEDTTEQGTGTMSYTPRTERIAEQMSVGVPLDVAVRATEGDPEDIAYRAGQRSAPACTTPLADAARAALPALTLLGDYIGNTFEGKVGIPAFDRCEVILTLKRALGQALPEQPEGTPTVTDWLAVVDFNRAELLRVQGEFGESDVSSERDAYLGALENLASAVRDSQRS